LNQIEAANKNQSWITLNSSLKKLFFSKANEVKLLLEALDSGSIKWGKYKAETTKQKRITCNTPQRKTVAKHPKVRFPIGVAARWNIISWNMLFGYLKLK